MFNQTLGCFLGVKLVRIDIYLFKICLCNVTDSMVVVHFNYQLKACVNYVFSLVQTKGGQDENYSKPK